MNDCSSILDDEFQILRVTSNLYNEVEELLVNVSVNQEFGCLINNIKESPIAIDELRKLIRHILSLGISFAIRHVESGRIVAGIANIIFMWDAVDSSFDINEHCQLDSTFEMEYMGTSPEFRGRGLATILCKHSFRLAKEMSQGTLQPELFAQLPEEMQIERPQAVVAITTSYTSRNMARKLEMQT
ncbi:hypothetical protein M5D96_003106, partial [Drosophila gunungcola]